MRPHHDDPDSLRPEPKVLAQRLESLRQSMGACRLGVARRLAPADRTPAGVGPGPFEVLAVAGDGVGQEPERALPLEAFHEMLVSGRAIEFGSDGTDPAWVRRLKGWGAQRVVGWPLPSDRLPSVYFVALYTRVGRDPGPVRMEVARGGMEALSRALAPPTWMPLAATPSTIPSRSGDGAFHELEGDDPQLRRLRHELPRLAASRLPVLVEAEIGCGGRRVVELLRGEGSDRAGELPECDSKQAERLLALLEAEEPPDAVLLRAPSELSVALQIALERRLQRIDGRPRLISVERGPLWPEVVRGRVRQDLYWRLAALRVSLPPLRQRPDDVVDLFRRAWATARSERGLRTRPLQVSAAAASALRRARWPGNLEQLRREARRVTALYADEWRLRPEHLSEELKPAATSRETNLEGLVPLSEAVAAVEELMIRRALRVAEGNKADAARRLRLSRQGLYRKLRRYGMLGQGTVDPSTERHALDSAEDSA